jgi:acetyltransferase-like isoleucine patch superfamily enzyme
MPQNANSLWAVAGAAGYLGSRVVDALLARGTPVLAVDDFSVGPPPYDAPVTIGYDVWVGCNLTILRGGTPGSGSAVGTGSVVTRSCPLAL